MTKTPGVFTTTELAGYAGRRGATSLRPGSLQQQNSQAMPVVGAQFHCAHLRGFCQHAPKDTMDKPRRDKLDVK